MKQIVSLIIFSFSSLVSIAGPGDAVINQLNTRIDELQYELDSKDGLTDGKIDLPNAEKAKRATELYIHLVDRLQREITDRDQLWMHTRDQLRDVKNWLVDTDPNQFADDFYLDKFEMSYELSQNKNIDKIKRRLMREPKMALNMYRLYEDKPFAYDVLLNLVDKDPELFMQNIWQLGTNNPHTIKIVDELVARNPIKMKRWVGTNTAMGKLLDESTNENTKLFTAMFYNFGRASKSFYFIDDVKNGRLTAQQAEQFSNDDAKFEAKLLDLSTKRGILGEEAIQDKMLEVSLDKIRPINDLHENHNNTVRFKSIQGLSTKELYSYMTYSEDEIFTSSYNGFYDLFLKKLGKKSGYDFLEEMNFNQYREFIKMAAGYSTLASFLNTMPQAEQRELLTKFVSNLEDGSVEESLQAAVNVADTFGSISNKELKDFFTQQMRNELTRVNSEYNQHGIRIYSLLNGILAQSDSYSDDWMNKLVLDYDIPKINELQYSTLKNDDGKIIEQVFFYDDDDGKASYNSFLPTFQNSKWNIADKKTYVSITSTDKKIEIYANKPQYEFEGKDALREYFRSTGKTPSVVIHRGHSFYVDTTINSLTPKAKLVLLGSCGGYNNLASVLDRSPDVHIISSKQIGAMGINDPMIRLLNNNFLDKENINWPKFWSTLGGQLKGNSTNYDRFKDYVPPHKNLGAIFIMAYNRMKEKDEGRL